LYSSGKTKRTPENLSSGADFIQIKLKRRKIVAEVKRGGLKVRDVTDPAEGAAGLVKESYLARFELTTSLREERLKITNGQPDNMARSSNGLSKPYKGHLG